LFQKRLDVATEFRDLDHNCLGNWCWATVKGMATSPLNFPSSALRYFLVRRQSLAEELNGGQSTV
jgi:hypothetical protein